MKIELKNIGKIVEAEVEICGITVIAGANDTGKSTVGKALYSAFNSVSNVEEQEKNARILAIRFALRSIPIRGRLSFARYERTKGISKKIYERIITRDDSSNLYNLIENLLFEELSAFDSTTCNELNESNLLEDIIQQIIEAMSISSKYILISSLKNILDEEFHKQICNFYSDIHSKILLTISNKKLEILLDNDNILEVDNALDLRTEIIYIDDPNIINGLEDDFYGDNHKNHIRNKLRESDKELDIVSGIILKNSLEEIYRSMNSVCIGSMKLENDSYVYKENGKRKPVFVENLSTGLKTFVVLKTLLQNSSIEKKGSIILDEPEVHLHPQWQLVFAELLVLLQKTFDLHILLNTHSPYFLRAIQVYAAKHEVADKCKYYLSRLEDDGAYIDDVSDDIEKIYSSLARPFQTLENEKWSLHE